MPLAPPVIKIVSLLSFIITYLLNYGTIDKVARKLSAARHKHNAPRMHGETARHSACSAVGTWSISSARVRVSGAMTMRLGRSRSPMRTGVKRGWTDMTALLDKGSSGDDDFARLFARLDEARASAIYKSVD